MRLQNHIGEGEKEIQRSPIHGNAQSRQPNPLSAVVNIHAQEEAEGEHEERNPEQGAPPSGKAKFREQHAVHVLQPVVC